MLSTIGVETWSTRSCFPRLLGRPLKSGLRELYPGVKARASSGWGRFRVSVLRMAVPTGCQHSRPPNGWLCFPGGCLPIRPHAGRRRLSLQASAPASALATARRSARPSSEPSKRPSAGPTARRTASFVPRPSARPSTAQTASSLIPSSGSPPPLPPTVLSTVEFQVSIRRATQTPSICFQTYVSQEL